ncbi:MAG: hypothetical protein EHM58_01185 [Ignavibacteriae bacterium]|nr:MAG: hypothetical protein EHM58_01185 [Ignavibacteriota bacterium]
MFKTTDRNYLYIFAVFFAVTIIYLLTEYIITGYQFGMPLDDSWIHFRFAENFALGHFYEFNIGDPTPGTTSPLWVVILSVPFLISRSLILPYACAVTLLFFFLTCIEVYRLALKLGFNKNYALLAGLLTVLNGRLIWSSLSGMEITLFCWLILVVLRIHLDEIDRKKIRVITGILLGIAALVRPETYLFGLLYYFSTLIILRKNLKENVFSIVFSFILFIIILSPYPVFSYLLTGKPLPNTFQGQQGALRFLPDINFMNATWRLFVKDNFIVFILWLLGSYLFIKSVFKKQIASNWLLIYLWIILLPVISAFLTPNWRHHGRYLIPVIPFINLAAISILQKLLSHSEHSRLTFFKYKKAIISFIIFFSFIGMGLYGYLLGMNVDNINDQQVNIANWINRNLPEEKIIALNDIGAITFLTGKKIIDMEGLVTPEMLKFRRLRLEDQDPNVMRFLQKNNVNYLIIYPEWYSYLMMYYSPALEKIYSAKLDNNTICGGDEMFIFKINWNKVTFN